MIKQSVDYVKMKGMKDGIDRERKQKTKQTERKQALCL